MKHIRMFVRAHDLSKGLRSEHVLMSGGYGFAAVFSHSAIGMSVVAMCYFTFAVVAYRKGD